ncbi:MAG: acetyl-CoA hydrolase/transferase C-terminal domain-containing protein [Porticoccaceae bacterium]
MARPVVTGAAPSLHYQDADALADAIIRQVGPTIVLALPLGLGKANHIANALYRRAAADKKLSLTILTALTLETPVFRNDLQRRFLAPVLERLYGDYPALHYAEARRRDALPDNIRVEEFFFLAGSLLGVASAQWNHICANYTHALSYLLARGVNVVAQLVAKTIDDGEASLYSASCNGDMTGDMLAARRAGKADFLFVGQVNDQLPFMAGEALFPAEEFAAMLDGPDCQFALVSPPKTPVALEEYAAGLHIARLVPDGGTLQIGIGSVADAVAHCLILRHRDNAAFRRLVAALASPPGPGVELDPFEEGLHGLSEMLVDTFLDLYEAGILRREVDGRVLDAAFFLGPAALYRRLREMASAERERFAMRAISYVNELYGDEENKRRARVQARFINKGMMATLLGEVISDGLENGQVVSGVGGQYNFVAQAFALEGARSIITLAATRQSGGATLSNIRWSYGHCTVPRHLRDIIVTEYGIADLRGKTDAEVIAAMLAISDSRFQPELLRSARLAGKIPLTIGFPTPTGATPPGTSARRWPCRRSRRCCRPSPSVPISASPSSNCWGC